MLVRSEQHRIEPDLQKVSSFLITIQIILHRGNTPKLKTISYHSGRHYASESKKDV